MAQSELGIILTMDTKDFVSEINNATKETRELQKDLNNINKQLKFDPKNVDLLTAKLAILKKQHSEVSKNFERYNKILKEMNTSIANGNVNLTKSDKKYVETARQVSIFGKQLENIKKEIADVSSALGSHDNEFEKYATGVEKANGKMEKSFMKAMTKSVALGNLVASAIKAIGKEMVKLGKDAIETFATYEDSIQHLKALYINSGEDISAIGDDILAVARGSVFTPDEIARAMNSMAKAGYSASQSLASVDTIMGMAAVSGEDTVKVSETLMSTMASFKGTVADLPKYANVLAVAANETLVDIKDLADSFTYVAPLAGTLGYSIEDVAGALALMSQQGIEGSQAGTALRSVMQRLATNTSKADTLLKKYNGTLNNMYQGFYDADNKARPFVDVLNDIRSVYNGLSSDAEKNNFLNTLGGVRGLSGLSALVNASTEDWDKLSDAIKNSSGYIDELMSVQYDSLKGDIQIMKSNWDSFKIEMGSEMPQVREIVQTISRLLEDETFIQKARDLGASFNDTINNLQYVGELLAPIFEKLIDGGKWLLDAANTWIAILTGNELTDNMKRYLEKEKEYASNNPLPYNQYMQSGGMGLANAILSGGNTNSLNLTTQIYVNNNGTPINEAEIRRWGDTITDMVSMNLGRRMA